jgi:hypothetical protein
MLDKVTYYAVVNDLSSRERPAGVFRRTYTEDGGRSDEAFTRNLRWEYSTSLISAERGDLQNQFIEITETEANEIVARIRARVTGTSNDLRTGQNDQHTGQLVPTHLAPQCAQGSRQHQKRKDVSVYCGGSGLRGRSGASRHTQSTTKPESTAKSASKVRQNKIKGMLAAVIAPWRTRRQAVGRPPASRQQAGQDSGRPDLAGAHSKKTAPMVALGRL